MIASRRVKIAEEEVTTLITDLRPKMEKYNWHCQSCRASAFKFIDTLKFIISEAVLAYEDDDTKFQQTMETFKFLKSALLRANKDMDRPSNNNVHVDFAISSMEDPDDPKDPTDLPN